MKTKNEQREFYRLWWDYLLESPEFNNWFSQYKKARSSKNVKTNCQHHLIHAFPYLNHTVEFCATLEECWAHIESFYFPSEQTHSISSVWRYEPEVIAAVIQDFGPSFYTKHGSLFLCINTKDITGKEHTETIIKEIRRLIAIHRKELKPSTATDRNRIPQCKEYLKVLQQFKKQKKDGHINWDKLTEDCGYYRIQDPKNKLEKMKNKAMEIMNNALQGRFPEYNKK